MKKYDIFLFDADGTLFDFNMAETSALQAVFDSCGLCYTEDILLKYRQISAPLWRCYEKGKITMEDLLVLRWVHLFNELGICYDAGDFGAKYLNELGEGTSLIDGAPEICEDIVSCNKQLYIVTNGIFTTQKSRIENSAIGKYISGFFVSGAIGFPKPHISFFEHVFSHIPQITKDRILIVGDSLSADIAGGHNAGIDSCWLNISGASNETDIIPTYEISALSELHELINPQQLS